MSAKLIPLAVTRIVTSSGPGVGSGRACQVRTSGPPVRSTTIACMRAPFAQRPERSLVGRIHRNDAVPAFEFLAVLGEHRPDAVRLGDRRALRRLVVRRLLDELGSLYRGDGRF